jgi:hypothetical protein
MAATDPRYLVAFTFGSPTQTALNAVGDADATLKLASTHWLATAARGDLEVLSGTEHGVRYVDLVVCALKVYPIDTAFGLLKICERTLSCQVFTIMSLVRWKSVESAATYGRLDAINYANDIEEAMATDAYGCKASDLPEIDPTNAFSELDRALGQSDDVKVDVRAPKRRSPKAATSEPAGTESSGTESLKSVVVEGGEQVRLFPADTWALTSAKVTIPHAAWTDEQGSLRYTVRGLALSDEPTYVVEVARGPLMGRLYRITAQTLKPLLSATLKKAAGRSMAKPPMQA